MVQLTEQQKEIICARVARHLPIIRKGLRLSQSRFGELAGISRARIIQVENGTAHLSWGQLTSVLFIFLGDARSKEYLYANNVLGPRFLQYMQQKDVNIPPQTNLCVHPELLEMWYARQEKLPKIDGPVNFTTQNRLDFCDHILNLVPELRRVMQMSQATLADLAGISRARLIQIEKKKVRLSWSQMTSILCVCQTNLRAKEYIIANDVLDARFLQYIQQKDGKTIPDTNICVAEKYLMSYKDMLAYEGV